MPDLRQNVQAYTRILPASGTKTWFSPLHRLPSSSSFHQLEEPRGAGETSPPHHTPLRWGPGKHFEVGREILKPSPPARDSGRENETSSEPRRGGPCVRSAERTPPATATPGHAAVNRGPFLQRCPGLLSTEPFWKQRAFHRCLASGDFSPPPVCLERRSSLNERRLHEFHFLITEALGGGCYSDRGWAALLICSGTMMDVADPGRKPKVGMTGCLAFSSHCPP